MPHFTMRSDRIQHKAEIHKFKQIHRLDSGPMQPVQNIVIPGDCLHHPSLIGSPSPNLGVIVPAPACLAAELLVRTSILDLMPTFQTHRSASFHCLRIFHTPQF